MCPEQESTGPADDDETAAVTIHSTSMHRIPLPQGTIAVTTWLAAQGTRSQCWQKMTAMMKKVKALKARAQKRLSSRRCSTYVT